MEKSDKLYRFRSKSQHMLVISYLGRRMKVKFSTPYAGVSRYSTSSDVIARQIRNSQAFKSGMIVEDESVEHKTKNESPTPKPRAIEPKNTPEWVQQGMKAVNKTEKTKAPAPETSATVEAETKATTGKAVQEKMFQITLDDVETYMDAKQYVNDVLHADLTRKEEVKAYCMEHNVVFPNFSFD